MDGNVPLCETTYEEVDLGVGKLPRYISEARCGGRCMGGIGTCEALYISEQVSSKMPLSSQENPPRKFGILGNISASISWS